MKSPMWVFWTGLCVEEILSCLHMDHASVITYVMLVSQISLEVFSLDSFYNQLTVIPVHSAGPFCNVITYYVLIK